MVVFSALLLPLACLLQRAAAVPTESLGPPPLRNNYRGFQSRGDYVELHTIPANRPGRRTMAYRILREPLPGLPGSGHLQATLIDPLSNLDLETMPFARVKIGEIPQESNLGVEGLLKDVAHNGPGIWAAVVARLMKEAKFPLPLCLRGLNAIRDHARAIANRVSELNSNAEKIAARYRIYRFNNDGELVPYMEYSSLGSMCPRSLNGCLAGMRFADKPANEKSIVDEPSINEPPIEVIPGYELPGYKPVDNHPIAVKPANNELAAHNRLTRPIEELVPPGMNLDKAEAELFIDLAEQQFSSLLAEHGLKVDNPVKLFSDINAQLPPSRFRDIFESLVHFDSESLSSKLGWCLLYFWGDGIKRTFQNPKSTPLDKATAVLSIVPIIGCSLNLANDMQHGTTDAVKSALCYSADGVFIITAAFGFPEIGFAFQVFPMLYSAIHEEKNRPDYEDADYYLRDRGKHWSEHVDKLHTRLESDEFIANITRQLQIRRTFVLHQASYVKQMALSHNSYDAFEAKLRICAAMADIKYDLGQETQNNTMLEVHQHMYLFRNTFNQEYLNEAEMSKAWVTNHIDSVGSLEDVLNKPLDYNNTLHQEILNRTMQRIETTDDCLFGGKKKCELGDCYTRPPYDYEDALHRVQVRPRPENAGPAGLSDVLRTVSGLSRAESCADGHPRPIWCRKTK